MTSPDGLAQGAILVGSVPLPTTEAVFRTTAAAIGSRVKRLPDGETGDRSYWIVFQLANIATNPAFSAPMGKMVRPFINAYARLPLLKRVANTAMAGSQAGGTVLARIKPGVELETINFGSLGYAEAATVSYREFAQLKRENVIPDHVRFQVALPTPVAPLGFFGREDQARLFPFYKTRLIEEVTAICAAVPPDQLAIQWDAAFEFAILENIWPSPFGTPEQSLEPILDMLAGLGNAVPRDVELGYHLCYGDAAHKHFVQPRDASLMANIARGVNERLQRPMTFLHFPVPFDRRDAEFLQPMRTVGLSDATELYVGLLHLADGISGARERVGVAQRVLDRSFGIATECGLGRSQPDSLPDTLRMHAALANPIVSNSVIEGNA
jgi:hypothetical protein